MYRLMIPKPRRQLQGRQEDRFTRNTLCDTRSFDLSPRPNNNSMSVIFVRHACTIDKVAHLIKRYKDCYIHTTTTTTTTTTTRRHTQDFRRFRFVTFFPPPLLARSFLSFTSTFHLPLFSSLLAYRPGNHPDFGSREGRCER
jgi:hypothetical protein